MKKNLVVAYADPPYPGMARKHYRADARCAEVDHAALIARLEADYDGWALSTGTPQLPAILALCPPTVRIGAWVKPFSAGKPGVILNYAWEPIIFKPVRKPRQLMVDWVSASAAIGTHREGVSAVKGQKPQAFCFWLYSALGLRRQDTLVDLYPGSGAVTRNWELWRRQLLLPLWDSAEESAPTGRPPDAPTAAVEKGRVAS